MMYRALRNLDFGKRGTVTAGSLFPGSWMVDKSREILEGRELIAPAVAPPLSVLKDWGTRARKLKRATGKEPTAADFLETDDAALAGMLSTNVETVQQLKRELLKLFEVPAPRG